MSYVLNDRMRRMTGTAMHRYEPMGWKWRFHLLHSKPLPLSSMRDNNVWPVTIKTNWVTFLGEHVPPRCCDVQTSCFRNRPNQWQTDWNIYRANNFHYPDHKRLCLTAPPKKFPLTSTFASDHLPAQNLRGEQRDPKRPKVKIYIY